MPAQRCLDAGACAGVVIQSSGRLRYALVDGTNVRDSRVHNYPPRWNAAPSQDLLVIRRNHNSGAVSLDPLRWGLIPYWCTDPKGDQCQVRDGAGSAHLSGPTASAAAASPNEAIGHAEIKIGTQERG